MVLKTAKLKVCDIFHVIIEEDAKYLESFFIVCSVRPSISKEVSPVRSYSKPEQSLDYRPRKTKPSSTHLAEPEPTRDKPIPAQLQKELEAKIRQRRRSHSVSSPADQGNSGDNS